MSEPVGKSTRDAGRKERKLVWKPGSNLATPEAPEGYKYRWVRHSIHGDDDKTNVISRRRQHYEPVTIAEIGSIDDFDAFEDGDRNSGIVRVKDLMLMKVPVEVAEQRTEFFHRKARNMQSAVDAELAKNDNEAMPISKEHRSRVSRGQKAVFDD